MPRSTLRRKPSFSTYTLRKGRQCGDSVRQYYKVKQLCMIRCFRLKDRTIQTLFIPYPLITWYLYGDPIPKSVFNPTTCVLELQIYQSIFALFSILDQIRTRQKHFPKKCMFYPRQTLNTLPIPYRYSHLSRIQKQHNQPSS